MLQLRWATSRQVEGPNSLRSPERDVLAGSLDAVDEQDDEIASCVPEAPER